MNYWDQDVKAINSQLVPKDPTALNQLVQPTTPWDAPDVPLNIVHSGEFKDLNGNELGGSWKSDIYRFPWYLFFMPYWYGFTHWCKTGTWPEKVLRFREDEQLDKEIFLDVIRHPQDFYSHGGYEAPDSGKTFDEFIKEVDDETAKFEQRVLESLHDA